MSLAPRTLRAPRPLLGLLNRLGAVLLVVITGAVLGLQYIVPNKRVLAVLAATVLFGVAWRVDMVSGLGVLSLALPFPRNTVFGNTNLAFILLLLVLWLLRVSQRQLPLPQRTPADAPMVAIFIAYVVSFYNVTSREALGLGLLRFEIVAATMFMFVLITRNIRSESDFRRLLAFQAVTVLTVCLLALFELAHPGGTVVPGWIGFSGTENPEINLHTLRVGSAFFDYELLAEFCALFGLVVVFLMIRAENVSLRVMYGGLLLLDVFVLFAAVTRGAFLALAGGLAYFLFLVRRRLRFVPLVLASAGIVALFLAMDFYVSNYTRSGSVVGRFTTGPQFKGIVPADRGETWTLAFTRMLEHPWIGHGPYYSIMTGTNVWTWPHCVYLLIANNVGLLGLAMYLWLFWTLFRLSKPPTDDLRRGPIAESYLIIARVQMVVFLVDEIKIDYLRNSTYQFQVWMMFALLMSARQLTHSLRPTNGQSVTR